MNIRSLPQAARNHIWKLAAIAALPTLWLILFLWPVSARDTPDLLHYRQPFVFAHGGGQGLAPPNSLAALAAATKAGADFLEIDLHQTRDGHLVIIHDETVDRTTNGSGMIEDMTLSEVKSLRLKGSQTLTIPTLHETLAAFPTARWVMEIKLGPKSQPEALCKTLRQQGATARTIVASFHPEAMEQFRRHCPEVLTSLHRKEVTRFVVLQKLGLAHLANPQGIALHVPERRDNVQIVTPAFVRAAHARGLQVHVWTVNDAETMERLYSMGVDGIFTDFPNRGLQVAANYRRPT